MDHSTADSGALAAFGIAYVLFFLILFLVILVVSVLIYWKIAVKAGYNGALSLLLLIPGVNFIIPIIFAFTEWPIERELKAWRAGGGGGTGFGTSTFGSPAGGGGTATWAPPAPPQQSSQWGPPTGQ